MPRTITWVRGALCMVAAVGLLGSAAGPSLGDIGTLKLKVSRCLPSGWISGAAVDVSIVRGQSEVDSDSGTTNTYGYVEFTFTSLQEGDEAHVTITPSGESADRNHVFSWSSPGGGMAGAWVIGSGTDDACADEWYDDRQTIIHCYYQ